MKLKYRIKQWKHPFAKDYYTAQYRILGLWLNINSMQIGRFTKPASTVCETLKECKERIATHKLNMERAKDIWGRFGTVIWETNLPKYREYTTCPLCDGEGKRIFVNCTPPIIEDCPMCAGKGKI